MLDHERPCLQHRREVFQDVLDGVVVEVVVEVVGQVDERKDLLLCAYSQLSEHSWRLGCSVLLRPAARQKICWQLDGCRKPE